MTKISLRNGILSFLLVLILMPIGHAIMILTEVVLEGHKFYGAALMGVLGFILIIIGIKRDVNPTFATLMGFLGGVLIWTGWVEFSFMWVAEKNNVANYLVDGVIATKREYLVMLSSLGLLCTITLFYLFTRTNCTFFISLQRYFGLRKNIVTQTGFKKPFAVIVFSETIMILWFFYILLLVVYDQHIAGDHHIATHLVAWGSLLWSLYLFSRLLRLKSFDYAIRYAVPTVIIFWNFIEILGRWNLFNEIWIQPVKYWVEITAFFIILILLLLLFIINPSFNRRHGNNSVSA